ncbi:MAG: NAD(+)/NADH kinase [Candidatus Omnitrophica bacterium]|nr:NAD(+)/NADH kinase [Candidatus Omnitrophota bacterium]
MMPKILVLYKRSLFQLYIKKAKNFKGFVSPQQLKILKYTHDCHYSCLDQTLSALKKFKIPYSSRCRGSKIDYNKYQIVITVGGDGTFLEAARSVKNQLIFGINSNPEHSHGRLCTVTLKILDQILHDILLNKYSVLMLPRLQLIFPDHKEPINFTNDILITHSNPAAMTRYHITIDKTSEEHRNSGIWISTAAGSSGAIHSAGGKILPLTDTRFQYQPRELFYGFKKNYSLKGGILSAKKTIQIISCMRNGMIFIDGAHQKIKFPIGSKVQISPSKEQLAVVIKK